MPWLEQRGNTFHLVHRFGKQKLKRSLQTDQPNEAQTLLERVERRFPKSLHGAPFLLPMEGSSLRRSLDQLFDSEEIRPQVRGQFGDCDLFEIFGSVGVGFFAIPTIVEKSVSEQHQVKLLGRIESIKERFFAISVERRLKHSAVVAITDTARQRLFE